MKYLQMNLSVNNMKNMSVIVMSARIIITVVLDIRKMIKMDKRYIRMCQDSGLPWDGEVGDLCSFDGETVDVVVGTREQFYEEYPPEYEVLGYKDNQWTAGDGVIPVFRQSELQKMARIFKAENDYSLTERFLEFIPGHGCDSSREQLWLEFVMKQKHGKTWNEKGQRWEKV
jgi:hypothetical protein